jgi:hypothetical protein
MNNMYRDRARSEWSKVRRRALWAQLQANLGHKKINLINFTELSNRFNLGGSFYLGVRDIPLDKIIGSVGRYQDFVQAFLPINESVAARWESVAAAYLNPMSRGLPPIEVYQVGDCYFVKDGNHRVSVARHLKLPELEAHVWEYLQPVAGLVPGVDIDTLLLEAERQEFLEKTRLDELRPDHTLRLTAPGGYTDILGQIAYYHEILSLIDEVELPYSEGIIAWYDMIYATTVQLIEQAEVLRSFPNRTAADFFIWVIQHHQQLEVHYSQPVMFEEAVRDIRKQHPSNRIKQAWQIFLSWLKNRSRW